MVYVKRVELTNFKSFGGTTAVPLLPGCTVISGPNGSGKSNILDALLFCLGLASSKGMRAERLPDLVNNAQKHQGRSALEASVTVTFDISDVSRRDAKTRKEEEEEEKPKSSDWSVTRRLRVSQQGGYTSNYYINGVACTLTELHEDLEELRIYPEGYNVVLQGDVTSIISMNARERREIIDELAGVATYDRKIVQAKSTLDEVKDKEDSCRIIQTELSIQCDRLSQDKVRAEKYQLLRVEFIEKQSWSAVLSWRSLQLQQEKLVAQVQEGDRSLSNFTTELTDTNAQINRKTTELDQLNLRVKALGEEELLAVQSNLATQEAERKQLQRQQRELETSVQESTRRLNQTYQEIQQYQLDLEEAKKKQNVETVNVTSLQSERDTAQQNLESSRQAAAEIATASEAWVQQQTALNRSIESLLHIVEPKRTEQAQLQERNTQLQLLISEQSQLIGTLEPELAGKKGEFGRLDLEFHASSQPIQNLAENLAATEQELQIQQDTQKRLLQEQRDKQRQLDKLEAQTQAQQEIQGTQASKVILQSEMPGLCGLVVQLAKVDSQYQLALEMAAGGRLGHIVVEDDSVASAGIELLKQKRAGRATFLPLNKIKVPKFTQDATLPLADGFVNYAVNLVECDRRYRDVFAYVFGATVVFATLAQARKNMGLYRIVTLQGELLETSGAMTGGSGSQRSSLRFDKGETGESQEVANLKSRLIDIDRILERCGEAISTLAIRTKTLSLELTEARQGRWEQQLYLEQLQKEIKSLTTQFEHNRTQLSQNTAKFTSAQSRLEILNRELPEQETQLQQLRHTLAELESSQTPSEWQQIQAIIKNQEQELQQRETALTDVKQQLQNLENQQQRLQEKIEESQIRVIQYQQEETTGKQQQTTVNGQLEELNALITEIQTNLRKLEENLGEEKKNRDTVEIELRSLLLRQQQLQWEIEKLRETQEKRREDLIALQNQLRDLGAELPSPLPEVPGKVNLEDLQKELRSLGKRLQAMEPVNMLALEEYDKVQGRLQELTEKLETLEGERTELLLRIENFTTLRQKAFKEAFDAVNENFQSIFAILSDGDGYLQLDNPEDPFNSGLNLVAHPKGKPVQRLASMSGGEKSLTALSFIFSLQRYRPSPFYAFDEVDMFLDGSNVERLARMIKQQAEQAQFIVVSLRRPMIESAQRTIGVTQARGAYTQVLGIKLQSSDH
ncbi:chromosome segregation protein SMC [Aphanizomenon flos-aquae NRERC-008]|uniref:Chromosome partition protein Smc n=1 Tax=Aphanizomenon flos-aquae FACHB-1249 TaxID=2692889 RepID=A0ABR8IR19_APHFL|nr:MULTISPECIES: chromosome segregation protein SMC [Aphanizomenon]MBD2389212.1 chromosome segregation protein SMC [Aphanizomenon flos-aquae FACHB-1171]MBD2555413.1 chromosome segregation protein SMC [Aphanizomenon flos-aquae FACHB-1290]MBD2631588.1 chromosome segregation protein SMC [Aphanizomenon sp. FACHB-1399]MBD2642314.1 chromosome segregation protein SMC [Aphanizomenon sp. FACHB-1401]MBD2656263.1 chromosome segregation protein SMC [Aphanizomenon flos-aquae FACHB-1265]